MRTCGLVEACSPRGPVYSGRLIARAVQLYRDGVKPGYIRWYDLQSTLQKEFPSEFPPLADDWPTPEAVMNWVRKYPDAPERLKDLGVQQAAPNQMEPGAPAYQPGVVFAVPNYSAINRDINALFAQLLTVVAVAAFCRFTVSLVTDR